MPTVFLLTSLSSPPPPPPPPPPTSIIDSLLMHMLIDLLLTSAQEVQCRTPSRRTVGFWKLRCGRFYASYRLLRHSQASAYKMPAYRARNYSNFGCLGCLQYARHARLPASYSEPHLQLRQPYKWHMYQPH